MLSIKRVATTLAAGLLTITAALNSVQPAHAQFDSLLQQAIGAAITQGLGQQRQRSYPYQQRPSAPYQQQQTRQQQSYGGGPSFDCRKAYDTVAATICSDPELSKLDREMADAFVAQLNQGGDPAALKVNQKAWRQSRNRCQADRACLAGSIRDRIAQLHGNAASSDFLQSDDGGGQDTPYADDTGALLFPHLPTLRGMPVLGRSDGQDETKWFMLLALSIDPATLSRNPEAYATRFLPYQSPLGGSGSWHSSNEFAEADVRSHFLAQYAGALRRSAIRLPQRTLVAQRVSFGKFDPERHGFPLPSRQPTSLQIPSGLNLNIVGNINFDGDFWPISEQSARALLSSSQTLARHEIVLATEVDLEASGRERGEIDASWTHAYLLNPDTQQVIADLGAPAPVQPPAPLQLDQKDPFVAWAHPPDGLAPWHLKSVDGAVAFTDHLPLMRMIAAGNLGDYLDRPNFYFQHAGLAQEMMLPGTYSSIFYAGANLNGKNEFEKHRSLERLNAFLVQLQNIAPKAPFDVTMVQNASLAEYNQGTGGFAINTSKGLGLSDIASQAGLTLQTSFAWPDFFWPVPPDQAERALRSQPDRDVKLAARITVESVDPVTGATAIALRSLALYGKALTVPLYRFPIKNDDPTAAFASSLAFKHEPTLDETLLCAEVLASAANYDRRRIDDDCTRIVAARDAALYADSVKLRAIQLGEAEAPFFPRNISAVANVDKAALTAWAKKYVAAARGIEVRYTPSLSQRVTSGISFEAVGHSENPTGQGFAQLLQKYQVRPEQLVHHGRLGDLPVYFITPNLAQLYNVVVPFASLKQDTSDGHPEAELTLGDAALTTNDSGSPLLLVKVAPKSLVVRRNDGNDIMQRDFADVPEFGDEGARTASDQSRPLDYALIDLLAIRATGDKLHPEAIAYMIKRRWEYEHSQTASIDRYFSIGQPLPGVDAIQAQTAAFVAWAVAHAPSLPLPVTLNTSLEVAKTDAQIPWHRFDCIGSASSGNLPASKSVSRAAYERLQCERGRETMDDSALQACSQIDELLAKSDRIGLVEGVCRRPDLGFAFSDPLSIVVRFDKGMPAPQITALGGKQDVKVQARLLVTAANGPVADPRETLFAGTSFTDHEQHDLGGRQVVDLELQLATASYNDARTGAALRPVTQDEARPSAPIAAFQPVPQVVTPDPKKPDEGQARHGPDLVGVRLGMSFQEAEALIRAHMQVGSVLDGVRLYDAQAKRGFIKPMTSGKLFVSEGGKEMIALIDEPPAAAQKVMAAWRRVYSPDGNIPSEVVMDGLRQKYGEPNHPSELSSSQHWSSNNGRLCYNFYGATHTDQLSEIWYENGAPSRLQSSNPRGMNVPSLADALFDPLNARYSQWKKCGPYVTASYLQTRGLTGAMDQLDMTLTDFGQYVDAYAASREQIRKQNPQISNEDHIKF